ncbi:hypothetical protein B0H19DRAFT_1262206 [Mycena capillaripes]|nr:hypothetical protein B0H19DRAFT_1262206 [Mycena capillaripes]
MGGPLPIRSLLLSRQNYEDIDESEEAIAVDEDEDDSTPMPLGIKASIRKKVIRAVRSSPQHRQQWCSILSPQNVLVWVHMLILDVKTHWPSTHQMRIMVLNLEFYEHY